LKFEYVEAVSRTDPTVCSLTANVTSLLRSSRMGPVVVQ